MGPLRQEYGILYADIDTDVSRQQSWYMDTAGHYNRPDVFDVKVDRTRRTAIELVETDEPPVPMVAEPTADAEDLF